jgi:pyruvate/2-oxoglutarate dehydrogenase complex dihydrolipoamide acyltransferase (E2) component
MKFLSSALFLALSISSTTTTQAFTVVTPSRHSHNNAITTSSAASSVSNTIKPSKVYNTRSSTATLTTLNAEPTKITMPALSSTMKEGRVVSWLKNEGDEVSAGEAIMVVESDKADMDVEAFEDGFIAKILVGEGESAPVGNVVALMVEEESDIAAVAAAGDGAVAASSSSSAEAAPAPASGESFNDNVEVVSDEKNQSSNSISRGNSNNNNNNNSDDNIHLEASIEMTEIFMPALSSTMVEGKIVSWLKDVGDAVSAGEAIMVVESDKADMDVEAFEDGYLAAILKQEGEMVDVGAPVGIIVSALEDVSKVVVSDASTKFDSSLTTSTTTTTTTSSSSGSSSSSSNSSTNPPLDGASVQTIFNLFHVLILNHHFYFILFKYRCTCSFCGHYRFSTRL